MLPNGNVLLALYPSESFPKGGMIEVAGEVRRLFAARCAEAGVAFTPHATQAGQIDDAILAAAAKHGCDMIVILVDNGSTDGTEEVMTARETEGGPMPFRYQRIAPAGPAGARNAGIAVARGEYLAFIDSDVELAPDWLALAAAELDDDAALQGVGGVVLYASDPGMVNAYGGVLSRIGLAWDADEGQPRAAIKRVEPRTWINCSAYLVRATAVRAVGGFDPRFFYGFEDSDLGWRISAVLGPQKVIPGAVCLHNVGEAIGRADARLIYHGAKNRLASLIANARATHLAWALPVYLAYALVDIALRGPRPGVSFEALKRRLTDPENRARPREPDAALALIDQLSATISPSGSSSKASRA